MENKILIDWLTCSTKVYGIDYIFDIFGFDKIQEHFIAGGGKNWYSRSIRFGKGIAIYFDGINDDMGICIEMSGQGCREFESYCGGNWYSVMNYVLNGDFKISRLDLAYDDVNGILPISDIRIAVAEQNYVSRMSKYKSIISSEGESVEIGSRSSDCMIRIYDKARERDYTDNRHWVRCELQMRGEIATNAGKELAKTAGISVNKLYFSILNNYLRFVIPDEDDTNKRRWLNTDYWNRFIQNEDVINLSDKLGVEYNIENLANYVINMAGNAIDTYIEIVGNEEFIKQLKSRSTHKNVKYSDLIEKHRLHINNIITDN